MGAFIGQDDIDTKEKEDLVEWVCTQIDLAVEKKYHEVSLNEIAELLDNVLNTQLKKNKNNLVEKIFNSKKITVGHLEIKLGDLENAVLRLDIRDDYGFGVSVNKTRSFGVIKSIIEAGEYRKTSFVPWFIIQGIYASLMNIDFLKTRQIAGIYI